MSMFLAEQLGPQQKTCNVLLVSLPTTHDRPFCCSVAFGTTHGLGKMAGTRVSLVLTMPLGPGRKHVSRGAAQLTDETWLEAATAPAEGGGVMEVAVPGRCASHTEVLGPPFLPIRHSAESRAVGGVLS